MYVNISYVRMCEPRFLFDTICSILVLIQFHGYSELRPTGIPQRFPPKCHLTAFFMHVAGGSVPCMCPIAFYFLKLYVKQKYLFTCMISSTIQGTYCWTLCFRGILPSRLAIKCMLLPKTFAATAPTIRLNVHSHVSLRAG